MCELFGMSAARSGDVGPLLTEFYSHSNRHPHGWGLALLYPNAVSLEKEPVPALHSDYLKRRLTAPVEAQYCIAHIRLATRGSLEYANTHPFIKRDATGRAGADRAGAVRGGGRGSVRPCAPKQGESSIFCR